jgi:hypothetical protein
MRNLSPLLVAVVLGACSSRVNVRPVELSAPAPQPAAVTLECVTRELDNLGFETTTRTADSSVTGIRINERPWYTSWLYGDTADQITATVTNGQLRVTAVSSDPQEIGEQGPPETGASETATLNAQEVLEACS